MAFFERLKESRINAGFTQEQLAEKLGIAKSTLSGYESGNREPTVATIAKAMDILRIDANYLYQDEMNVLGGSPMQLKYDEMKHIEKYRDLDNHGKEIVDIVLDKEWDRSTAADITSFPTPLVNAAHERTDIDVTDEMRKHDDEIMNDDSEWE